MKCESVSARAIKGTILIAEKNDTQTACNMRDLLELSGYEVVLAQDSDSVFSAVSRNDLDVILLDRLPHDTMICRRLKQNPNTSGIPIIILTDTGSTTDKVAGLAAGADDCISLPYNDEELSALICARLRAKSEWDELREKARYLEDMLTRVESVAYLDPLTGLFNRRRFEAVLSSELKRANRYELPLSCLVVDIDHFKAINDTYGHQTGDEVLRKTAALIQKCVREVDIAARWGGEEFVIVNPNTERKNALIVGQKILKAISSHPHACIGHQPITVSIGVAGVPHPDIRNALQLVHAADLAMYEAKRAGRNRVIAAP